MKIAIIGGTSFIGQNLIKHLDKKKIRIIATYNSNKPIKTKFSTVWKKLDIRKNKKNYLKYLEYPDIVLNLAWPDIPNYRLRKHFKTFYYQKKFNHNLIKNGLKNLIILGTCYEYGKINGRISETATEKPTIAYAKSKLKLLRSILELKKNNYFKFTWLRPFFVYGENKKRRNLFSLIKEIDKNRIEKLQICGNLVRDFISIKLLCSIIFKIIMFNKDLGILNICCGKGTTVKHFIKKNLKNKKNLKKIDMDAKNPNNFEPNYFWGDNSKLKKILKIKFKPNY
jgi:nucleoside-diphosphate-sugar epimerase